MSSVSAVVKLGLALILAISTLHAAQRNKKEKEPKTQTLEVLPDLPLAVAGETARLIFGIAPPRTQGLLSRQVRDSVKAMFKQSRRARIMRLRAFVAGSGDSRRVQTVVREVFGNNRRPLPTLSVVQVGKLSNPGAQVILEYIAEHRKPQNPHGLALLSGQTVTSEEPTLQVAGLVRQALDRVRRTFGDLGLTHEDVLRITCYCSSIDDAPKISAAMREAFPGAARNYVQLRRVYTPGSASCEAVARLRGPANAPLRFINIGGQTPDYSQLALIGADRVAVTGSQLAFRWEDTDIRLAYDRMGKILEKTRTSYDQVAMSNIYPISMRIADKIRSLGFEYFDQTRPPASTLVELEGLPSLDASFGMDLIAVIP